MSKDECVFCRIAKKDIPVTAVYEDAEVIAFDDIKPQAPVHVLIIPKTHIERLNDLGEKDAAMTGKLVLAAREIAKKRGIHESGYRIVLNCNKDAGQEVFHIHAHLLGGRKFAWPPG